MEGKDKLSFLATVIWENNGPLHKAQVARRYKNLIVQKELNHQEGGLAGEKFYWSQAKIVLSSLPSSGLGD